MDIIVFGLFLPLSPVFIILMEKCFPDLHWNSFAGITHISILIYFFLIFF